MLICKIKQFVNKFVLSVIGSKRLRLFTAGGVLKFRNESSERLSELMKANFVITSDGKSSKVVLKA